MQLCFGSFAAALLANGKNNAVTKIFIGRELLDYIAPDYTLGKDDRYIYYFLDRKRELPKELKGRMKNTEPVRTRFAALVDAQISPDHERLRNDLKRLISGDAILPDGAKNRLLSLADTVELPSFLAEVFVFTVDNTKNIGGGANPRASKGRRDLITEITATANNKKLCDLAAVAIREGDTGTLAACLGKMTNNVYLAKALVRLSQVPNFNDDPEFMRLFHETFSRMENNKYRHQVFVGGLESDCFKEHPSLLWAPHMCEYTNDRYVYETLIFLCELSMKAEAEQYRHLLTNKVYIRRLDAYLAELNVQTEV